MIAKQVHQSYRHYYILRPLRAERKKYGCQKVRVERMLLRNTLEYLGFPWQKKNKKMFTQHIFCALLFWQVIRRRPQQPRVYKMGQTLNLYHHTQFQSRVEISPIKFFCLKSEETIPSK